ncbi:hypothetical protein EXIGLDRAFT_745054 [Exidia glandulosa HHB12029]|uniref:Uncharacterized protein n=1 Tax=Exidia glandulosa HHB12029 TaxID=1314781 RepID=A0A165P0X2_EXIGL|nr:hypothetical protein EXIGLDRAFT_745054 [Exidia glandulosa HHB12029]
MSFVYQGYNQDLHDKSNSKPYGLRGKKRKSMREASDSESSADEEQSEDDYAGGGDQDASESGNSSPEPDSDDDDDFDFDAPSPRKRARVSQPKWTVSARVRNLATEDEDGKHAELDRAKERLKEVDTNVLDRIKKALTLAAHEGTGEAEARNAMRMAHKLMQTHNVSQADVMAKESDEQKAKRAGASVVEITSRSAKGERGTVTFSSWYAALAHAMTTFFNVKVYSTKFGDRSRLTWTFYGLAEGTVAAARAFEWIHNLILQWKNEKTHLKGVNAKNMYCNGVADELMTLARNERKQEAASAARAEKERLKKAREEEEAQRAAELARLQPLGGDAAEKKAKVEDVDEKKAKMEDDHSADEDHISDDDDEFGGYSGCAPYGDEDDDDDYGDFNDADEIDESMDLDAALRNAEDKAKVKVKPDPDVKPPPAPTPTKVKPEPKDDEDGAGWASTQQLQLFRDNASAIADAFLVEKKLKLGKGRMRARPVARDENAQKAYKKGREDGKSIEVRRKRIEGAKA